MRYKKTLASMAVGVGILFAGSWTLSAQNPYWQGTYDRGYAQSPNYYQGYAQGPNYYQGYGQGPNYYEQDRGYWQDRDIHHDYHRVRRMRGDLSRDQERLDEAIRCGRYREADAIQRDMARDQDRLYDQYRDIHHDLRHRDRDDW